MHYEVSTTIDAPPEQIWPVLADAEAWSSWDSGVVRVEGPLVAGSKIRLVSEVAPDRTFKLKVSDLHEPRGFTLSSGMPLGLFRGVRTYRLEPAGAGTRFEMREQYSGPMAGMITKAMPDLQPSFDRFAAGLKATVEASAGA